MTRCFCDNCGKEEKKLTTIYISDSLPMYIPYARNEFKRLDYDLCEHCLKLIGFEPISANSKELAKPDKPESLKDTLFNTLVKLAKEAQK
jgi:hypothetical protein